MVYAAIIYFILILVGDKVRPVDLEFTFIVIPAKAGTQFEPVRPVQNREPFHAGTWVPAFAGMTMKQDESLGAAKMQNCTFTTKSSESSERFVAAMGMAATGVSVVTTDGPAGRFGLTVSAVSSVSADPPMVLACVNRKSPAAAAIDANGLFSINVLAAENRGVAETFAGRPSAGKPYDFGEEDWNEGGTGLPVLSDAAAVFECETEQAYDAGTHRIFIGRVVAAKRGEAKPLVYCNRAFGRVADY